MSIGPRRARDEHRHDTDAALLRDIKNLINKGKIDRTAVCEASGDFARKPHEPFSGLPRLMMRDPGEGVMNNASLLTADRMTHLKIVVVSLICATLVAGVGVAARVNDGTGQMEASVVKIGKSATAAAAEQRTIR
jgi:hypothetical protein